MAAHGCHGRDETGPVLHRFQPYLWAFLPPILLNAIFILQPWFDKWLIYVDPLLAAELTEACCERSLGMASNIGVLYWTVGAACCGFAAAVLWTSAAPRPMVQLLTQAALLTGFLGIDDLIMLHDSVFPRLGVPEPVTFGVYGLLGLAYLVLNRRLILQAEPWLFLAAVGFLVLSLAVDATDNKAQLLWKQLLEEGAKLMGIAGWCVWHVRVASRAVRGEMAREGESV
jgi:hypothetical protein